MLPPPSPSANHDRPPTSETASRSTIGVRAACALAALGCVLAWVLPSQKAAPGPFASEIYAFGRYAYPEFMTAVVATALFLSTLWLALSRPEKRRIRLFRVLALWLGTGLAVGASETIASHVRPRENPFYTFNEGGVAGGADTPPELRYVRPPLLRWEGRSRGDIPEWLPDPHARHLVFETDWQGFRNPSEIRNADLVFIGDSFTEAGNVGEEETFVRRTASEVARTGRNLGLFGYSPQEELIVLEKYGLPCEPKVVVWQLCEGNDLNDAVQYARRHLQWEAAGRPGRIGDQVARHTAWTQYSPTYWLFQLFAKRTRFWLEASFRDAQGTTHSTRFSYLPPRVQPASGTPATRAREIHRGLVLIAQAIHEGRRLLDARGIRLVILFLPTKMTTMGDLVVFDSWSMERLPARWQVPERESFGTLLGRFCKERGIPYVDATRALRQEVQTGELTFLPFDTHLSPRGHEIVSELLVKELQPLLSRSGESKR
jgi:hypothetical protein